jgi:hypothetical protein
VTTRTTRPCGLAPPGWSAIGASISSSIDGVHSYDGVKCDFEMYGSLVNPGGLIAFHDINYSCDVRRFWDEVKVGRRFQEICVDHGQTYGIGLIYN